MGNVRRRMRLRDLGVTIGRYPTGPFNAITDVPDLWVGHATLISDDPAVIRTGVTVVVPRAGQIWDDYAFCGRHSFNGNGEMTGLPWIDESGMLGSVVALTNTHQVGMVRDALVRYSVSNGYTDGFVLPVVAETYDGWLSDIDAFPLTEGHVAGAMADAGGGPVTEGNVGGGTGMICHEFKGGIGTSSRLVDIDDVVYAVGVLVQTNYGIRSDLRIDGVPVGRVLGGDQEPSPFADAADRLGREGSVIMLVATDAPLLPVQCRRLAQRTVVGLARVGGGGRNGSGDLALALATGNHLPAASEPRRPLEMIRHDRLNPMFAAVADATEEAILNALCAADTMTGYRGRTAHALPLERVAELLSARAR